MKFDDVKKILATSSKADWIEKEQGQVFNFDILEKRNQ